MPKQIVNKEKARIRSRKYRLANKAKVAAASERSRKANPEKYRAQAREYNQVNSEKRYDHFKKWAEKNPDKKRANEMKQNLKKTYGMTPEDYNNFLALQRFCCAICHRHISEFSKAFAVDHDHACCPGKRSCGQCIRGLLCTHCNLAIGLLHACLERCLNAAHYLGKK